MTKVFHRLLKDSVLGSHGVGLGVLAPAFVLDKPYKQPVLSIWSSFNLWDTRVYMLWIIPTSLMETVSSTQIQSARDLIVGSTYLYSFSLFFLLVCLVLPPAYDLAMLRLSLLPSKMASHTSHHG